MEKKSIADQISDLPDEILHCVLSRIKPKRKAAQTITLSRRWRSLWRSYPVVHFSDEDALEMVSFQRFGDDTMKRFSRDSSFRMETLDILVPNDKLCFPVFKQLLELSSERKAEEVYISAWGLSFPFRLLSNSFTKILTIEGVRFSYNDDLPISLNSLRFLHLNGVQFDDDGRLFRNLIASSPVLETLEIDLVLNMRELKVSTHHTCLKTLRIARCYSVEIKIAAPGLETLLLEELHFLTKFELTAPQLSFLEFTHYSHRNRGQRQCYFDIVTSELQSLESLIIYVNDPELEMKPKLSNPELEWG